MSLKRLAKITLALLLIPLIAGVLAYLASPGIAQGFAGPYLESFGATNVNMDIQRPGLRGIFINSFEARWQGFDVSLQSVQVTYTMNGLLNGQIEAVSLKQATATGFPDTQSPTPVAEENFSKVEVPAALFTWPELLTDSLPGRIEISEILIQDSDNKIRGELVYSTNTLSMQGDVQLQWLNTVHSYALAIDQNRKLDVTLFQDKSVPEVQLSVQSDKTTLESMQLHGELYVSADIASELLQPFLQDLGIQEMAGELDLDFKLQAPLQETGPIALEDMQLSGSITPGLRLSLLVPNYENYSAIINWNKVGTLTVSSRQFHISPGPHFAFSGPELEAELDIAALQADLVNFSKLDNASLTILPGATLKLSNLTDNMESELSIPLVSLSIHTPLNITLNQEAQSFGVQATVLNLEVPRLTYNQLPYTPQPILVEIPDIHLDWNEGLDLTIKLRNVSETLSASVDIKTDNKFVFTNSHLSLVSQDSLFDALFSNWKHEYDANGTLIVNLTASLIIKTLDFSELSGELILESSNLFFGDLSASDVNIIAPFRLSDTQIITDWVGVNVGQSDVGVALTNIEGSVRYSPSALDIGAFKMQVLGGEAHSKAVNYAFGSSSAHTQISFSNIQLSHLVALADNEIEASGVIDGSIELSGLFGENGSLGLVIENGSLSARPPGGLIRYVMDDNSLNLAKQSDFDFALTALKNFDYQQLNSSITLSQDGELKLGVSLLGNNPQVKDGRPIQYNLNIDQNLFTLLRSLQLSNKLSNRIGEKLAD